MKPYFVVKPFFPFGLAVPMGDLVPSVWKFPGSNYHFEILEVIACRPTAAVYLGSHLLGIWGLGRIGVDVEELGSSSPMQIDVLGTTILLRKLTGELTCP
jgi:hypothetical protein